MVDPLADITSYILEHNPRNAVPHVPSVSPLPTSLLVHVSSWAGFLVGSLPLLAYYRSQRRPHPPLRASQVWLFSVRWLRMNRCTQRAGFTRHTTVCNPSQWQCPD